MKIEIFFRCSLFPSRSD